MHTEAPRNYNCPTSQSLPDDTHDVRRDTVTPNRMHLQTLGVGYFSILHQLHQHERTYQADAKEADYKNMEEAAIDEPADGWYAGHDQDDND